MASDNNDLKFVEYLGNVGVVEKEKALNEFLEKHEEIAVTEDPISPKVYQALIDQYFEPANEERTYIIQELKSVSDSDVAAREKYDSFIKTLIDNIIFSILRVNWKKTKKHHQQGTVKWLDKKYVYFTSLINDENNDFIVDHLTTIRASFVAAKDEVLDGPDSLVKAKKGTATTGTGKRPPSEDGTAGNGPVAKKAKQQIPFGKWWGTYKEKLSCPDSFFETINQSKEYLANPTDLPGTRENRLRMVGFLRRALDDVGLRVKLNELLLMTEFVFRSRSYTIKRGPMFIIPGIMESSSRLGAAGWYGLNDLKKMLGGGFSPDEISTKNLTPPPAIAQGMVALARSQEMSGLRLRGGGSSKVADKYIHKHPFSKDPKRVTKRIEIREGMAHRLREPAELWDQLLEDATFPKGVWMHRIHENRPPMVDPGRMGPRTAARFKKAVEKIPRASEWDRISKEDDEGTLRSWADTFAVIIETARGRVYDFLYGNHEIFPDEPSLLQPSGRDKPKTRYGKTITDKSFAKFIGYAFRARVYQALRFHIVWIDYLLGNRKLAELLKEERILYEVWSEHEDLYLNWENNKWFELSNPWEIASLESRYQSREILRLQWKREIAKIDEAIENLNKDSQYYNDPAKNKAEGKVIPSQEASSYVPPPGYAEILAALDDQLTGKQSKQGKKPPKKGPPKSPTPEIIDPMDVDEDEEMSEGGNDDNNDGNSKDGMDVDNESEVDPWTNPGGKTAVDKSAKSATKDTSGCLEYLLKTRDTYDKKLNELIKINNTLDPLDVGNRAAINRNNLDIMAKNQVIWSLDTEIHNLKRAVDPLADGSHGKGADHSWELPPEDYYYKWIKQIPKQPEVPLGHTSLGRGPLPGAHPKTGHPRVFVGGCAEFGTAPDPDEEAGEPVSKDGGLFGPNNDNNNKNKNNTWGNNDNGWDNDGNNVNGTTVMATPGQEILDKIREYLRRSNTAEVTIRQLSRATSSGKTLNELQKKALEKAQQTRKDSIALVKSLKDSTDAYTRARAELVEQEEREKLLAQIKLADESADKAEKNYEQTTDFAASIQKEMKLLAEKNKKEAEAAEAAKKAKLAEEAAKKKKEEEEEAAEAAKKAKLAEEAAKKKEEQATQPKSTIGLIPKPEIDTETSNEKLLLHAIQVEENSRKARNDARADYEDAVDKADLAQSAVKANSSDPELKDKLVAAEDEETDAAIHYSEWINYHRIAHEAVESQMRWYEPAEMLDQLENRFKELKMEFQHWINGREWGDYSGDNGHMMEEWILNCSSLIFQSLKAVNINPGVDWWWEMHEGFWNVPAATIDRKRKIWLFTTIRQLNHRLSQMEPPIPPFLELPPQPPADWEEPTPNPYDLIEAEHIQLGLPGPESEDEEASVPSPVPKTVQHPLTPKPTPDPVPVTGPQITVQGPSPKTAVTKLPVILEGKTVSTTPKVTTPKPETTTTLKPPPVLVLKKETTSPKPQPVLVLKKEETTSPKPQPFLVLKKEETTSPKPQPFLTPKLQSTTTKVSPKVSPPKPPPTTTKTTATTTTTPTKEPLKTTTGLSVPTVMTKWPSPPKKTETWKSVTTTMTKTTTKKPKVSTPNMPATTKQEPTPPTTTAELTGLGEGGGQNDAWPELSELVVATWTSLMAHDALRQKEGDTSNVPGPDRSLWPKPVYNAQSDTYCL